MEKAQRANVKILVVNDNPELLDLTVRMLRKEGYLTLSARSAAGCMDVLSQTKPDLILIEVFLPDMNGKDLCRNLKNRPEFSSVYIILLSSSDISSEKVSSGLEYGADSYITRPVSNHELFATIDAGLRSISAENKIRTDQVLLQACIDSPDDMSILAIDKQYNYLAFNAYYYKVMLQSCGTEIKPGMNLFDCMKNKEDKIKVKIDYDRAMAGQSFIAIEESGEMDDQYFETRYNPIYNKKNEIIGATAFSVNVTERKQMELALNEKSNDLHKELEKKRNAEIALQKSHKILEKSKLATINLLEDINLEMDQRKHVEEELSKLNDELEQRVTERTAQLEAVNNELQAFAYSVSHDLRAPLRAIDGFSKFMLDGYGPKLDPEGKRLLGLIRSNTQKMDQLIIDILALSKVTRSEHKVSKVDMTKMVMSMLNEIASPDIQANLSILIDPLQNAYADPTYIKQVWINLISNAIKFSSLKNKPEIKIGSFVEKGFHVYYIKDNGVGFNPEYAHKLFGVFQRLHKVDEFEGTGVGLAIVKRIVIRHGGKVWAEGAEGKGATFYFSIPVKSGE